MTRHACRWEICRSVDGLFFARFIAGNGRRVVVTETYTRKENAIHAIRVVQHNARGVEIRDITGRA